jgi:hypothetical protein
MNAYALVGVVTNKYRYVKMTYTAASGIPASKTAHVVGDNSNNGEEIQYRAITPLLVLSPTSTDMLK